MNSLIAQAKFIFVSSCTMMNYDVNIRQIFYYNAYLRHNFLIYVLFWSVIPVSTQIYKKTSYLKMKIFICPVSISTFFIPLLCIRFWKKRLAGS